MEPKNQIMKELKHKKISIKLIIFSVLGILISHQLKIPKSKLLNEWKFLTRRNITVPNDYYCIDFFGFEVSYNFIFIFFSVSLGLGIYMALYKNDEQMKHIFKFNFVNIRLFFEKLFKNIYKFKFGESINKKKTIIVTAIISILIFLLVLDKNREIEINKNEESENSVPVRIPTIMVDSLEYITAKNRTSIDSSILKSNNDLNTLESKDNSKKQTISPVNPTTSKSFEQERADLFKHARKRGEESAAIIGSGIGDQTGKRVGKN